MGLLLYTGTLSSAHLVICAFIRPTCPSVRGAQCSALLSSTLYPAPLEQEMAFQIPGLSPRAWHWRTAHREPQRRAELNSGRSGAGSPVEWYRELVLLTWWGWGSRNPGPMLIKHNFTSRRSKMCFQNDDTEGSLHTAGGSSCLGILQEKGSTLTPGPTGNLFRGVTILHPSQKMAFQPMCKVEEKAGGLPRSPSILWGTRLI